MSHLVQDLRHAVRSLAKHPAFSTIVVVTMAIGIGANVAMFAYLAYFLWPTMQAPQPERLVWLFHKTAAEPGRGLSYPDFVDLDGAGEAFAEVAAYRLFGSSLQAPEKTVYAWGTAVSGDYFPLFGARPHLGRLLGPEDDRPGAEPVLVMNHGFWQRHFGGDPGVVGATLELDGRRPTRVVGIAAPGFQGQGLATGIYVPMATADVLRGRDDRRNRSINVLARLAPAVTVEKARAVLVTLARGLDAAHPEDEARDFDLALATEFDESWGDEPLIDGARVLSAAVALLLLLACANVANLMLARATSRRREMAVHAALGADRWRLGRRLLLEGLILAVVGGTLGLALARAALQVIEGYLVRSVPVGMGEWALGSTLVVDPGLVGLFFALVTVATGLVFGAAPAVQVWRQDLVVALKSDSTTSRPGRRFGGRQLLVVAQVAISVVLLVGAALLARTFLAARHQDMGFAVDGRMLATVYLPRDAGGTDAETRAVYRDLLARVEELPGVRRASFSWRVPGSFLTPDEYRIAASDAVQPVATNVVSPGYFDAIGIPLLEGRDFAATDTVEAPGVVVVSRKAAEELWPGRSPLGEQVTLTAENTPDPAGTSFTVVGVVADSHQQRPTEPLGPVFFFPLEQRFRPRSTLVVEAEGAIAKPLHDLLRDRYPRFAILDLQPLAEQMRRAVVDQRMNADFAGAFGAMGLLLAALGIFSVMSWTTSRRTREIGIRMALGADRGAVRRLVFGETGRLVGAGVVVGGAAALALARLLERLLYGVGAFDPWTFAAVPAVLAAVGLLAALPPARRAARVEPVVALREE